MVVSRIEEEAMSLCGYHSICDFSNCCHSFDPCLCRLLPFHLSYITASRPCHLVIAILFYPNWALLLQAVST